jgi:hypothetical protein
MCFESWHDAEICLSSPLQSPVSVELFSCLMDLFAI